MLTLSQQTFQKVSIVDFSMLNKAVESYLVVPGTGSRRRYHCQALSFLLFSRKCSRVIEEMKASSRARCQNEISFCCSLSTFTERIKTTNLNNNSLNKYALARQFEFCLDKYKSRRVLLAMLPTVTFCRREHLSHSPTPKPLNKRYLRNYRSVFQILYMTTHLNSMTNRLLYWRLGLVQLQTPYYRRKVVSLTLFKAPKSIRRRYLCNQTSAFLILYIEKHLHST